MNVSVWTWSLFLAAMVCGTTASQPPILVKGGRVVNSDQIFYGDVLIEDGLISGVGSNLQVPEGVRVVDAKNKFVMPGGIDPHTHLEMPFMGQEACDDFFSGQAAALAGGTTMHIDFALPAGESGKSLAAGFEKWKAKAAKSCMDYGFHMAVTSWSEEVARDMELLVNEGINSFKFFLAYKGALMVSDSEFLQGLAQCRKIGAIAQVHCENGDAVAEGQTRVFESGVTGPEGHALSRPAVLEGEATARAVRLAKWINTPLYVVHVMSIDALEEVSRARLHGQRVVGEPVVSGLALEESRLWDPDFKVAAQYVMSPPIRSEEHGPALKNALASGVLQIVATDHAVFNSTQKAVGKDDFRKIPNGVNGIEERMHVVWEEMVVSGLMSPMEFVRATSTAAAQVFNIYPRKGIIAPGSDADIIILDPSVEHTISASKHHSRMDTNVYEGKIIHGKVVTTISRGRIVWENNTLRVEPGTGRFIPMKPFGPLFDGLDDLDKTLFSKFSKYGTTPVSRSAYETARDEL
mmetsp:Transcript_24966/g.59395  ORF Transcript_24966/g.59395 Transcript_24966/m.59395 type:complete len:521 (+) Transcript_24966:177-1739(+)|eukprot:CAMPEP_0177610522 /NCGR_PEP_ID=MMETSP0419_2-20121207/19834_1 /TAXON_ID=582737 /ORGANISM="Tetraselmis sp., Strain GSL018" /LENGTH=520 /DNA_ID=CAMNT_0019105853 /DNA_START=1119 /DNA_END=2681 /DNA_ORIENTATION=+